MVLVGEVVGVKGLRGEEPPEKKNSVKETGFKDGSHTQTHTNKISHLILNLIPYAPAYLFPNPLVRNIQCMWSHSKIRSAYETTGSFFMVIHLKPDQLIGTKSPKMTDSENVRCPCSGGERLIV